VPTDKFGVKLREQVEERLAFYEGGSVPRKNVDVMREVQRKKKQTNKKHVLFVIL
jgi:nucleolar protein 56